MRQKPHSTPCCTLRSIHDRPATNRKGYAQRFPGRTRIRRRENEIVLPSAQADLGPCVREERSTDIRRCKSPARNCCSRRKPPAPARSGPSLSAYSPSYAPMTSSSLVSTVSRAPRPSCCASRRRSRRKTLDFNPLRSCGALGRYDDYGRAHGAHRLRWHRGVRALADRPPNRGRTARGSSTRRPLRPPAQNCDRTSAPALGISLKKENPSAQSPVPSMSMSQRSIAASTTKRPYDSTSFRSHARS